MRAKVERERWAWGVRRGALGELEEGGERGDEDVISAI